jgi:hypothetical protein
LTSAAGLPLVGSLPDIVEKVENGAIANSLLKSGQGEFRQEKPPRQS